MSRTARRWLGWVVMTVPVVWLWWVFLASLKGEEWKALGEILLVVGAALAWAWLIGWCWED